MPFDPHALHRGVAAWQPGARSPLHCWGTPMLDAQRIQCPAALTAATQCSTLRTQRSAGFPAPGPCATPRCHAPAPRRSCACWRPSSRSTWAARAARTKRVRRWSTWRRCWSVQRSSCGSWRASAACSSWCVPRPMPVPARLAELRQNSHTMDHPTATAGAHADAGAAHAAVPARLAELQ